MTVNECSKIVDSSEQTVKRWCKKRGLKYTKKGLQGIIDISEEDLKHFCDEHGIERKGDK